MTQITPTFACSLCLQSRYCWLLYLDSPLGQITLLYDLDADPHETRNVIDDPAYAEPLARLRDRLHRWMQDTSDPALRMFRWRYRCGV